MIQRINFTQFVDAFDDMERGKQFSYAALKVIFDYLENLEEDTGEPIELDVIAICCGYEEMTLAEFNDSYSVDFETLDDVEDYLNEETFVAGKTADTIVFQLY